MASPKTDEPILESDEAIAKIFKKFDIKSDGVIDFDEIKIALKSVGLYPSNQKIKDIIKRVDLDRDGVVNFEEFVAMRRNEEICELNVLAQFKKYDVIKYQRGFITAEGIETVLKDEGVPDDSIRDYVDEFMTLDSNGDGKVSFLDLYESMMTRIPDEWLEWIHTNIVRGVPDEVLVKVLVENGFNHETASRLIEKTKKEGRMVAERGFVETGPNFVTGQKG
ncbi:putative Calmodulin [Monocercomonoides exilis]|uniref:putative Calmodulin n=1 Tax=Monocercomonoides exilis TaxID=2049356 RepID=UPI0035599F86|nr:putative Calmodulin [Monocercomonoides exilis]|eukprot:MONOS_597.1-p1 / transcript=MONOS_597.1 / gene=MONOS_597 / organism=Monocercomonoides_exilis_PA203 / gene_product=Calmodulin / transcript_product=Calmodulin / location=Mono_scaffold00009:221548-222554(+) / protein_length=222 / sequence_SO=supercontig / SO=protein_coding / is_pseudo=false